jgi:Rap1a immunity proteins
MPGILIATLLATVSAKAPMEYASGDLLFSDCAGSRQFVTGYVSGWLDKWNRDEFLARRAFADAARDPQAMVSITRFGHSVGWNICLPPGTTPVVIGDMLCHFLQENPGVRSSEGDDLVMTVVTRSYGCR